MPLLYKPQPGGIPLGFSTSTKQESLDRLHCLAHLRDSCRGRGRRRRREPHDLHHPISAPPPALVFTMVKIGRSLASPSDGFGIELGGEGASARTVSSISPGSQKTKVLITVALVRKGFAINSETKRIMLIDGDKTFSEFRSSVCESLGLTDTYPISLTVMGVLAPIKAGTLMATLYEEASQEPDFDGVLFVRH